MHKANSKERNQKVVRITWAKENPEEVRLAEERFREYIRRGYVAYALTREKRRVQIFSFDKELEGIFLVQVAFGG